MITILSSIALLLASSTVSGSGAGAPDVVSRIRIVRGDVFEPDSMGIFSPLARLGNAIHVTTRERIVRDLLLFGEGDRVTPDLLRESERVLRGSGLFRTASVTRASDGDSARVRVMTRDAWSTQFILNYSTSGGDDELTLGAIETNFLGTGDAVSGLYRWADEADSYGFGFLKRRLFGPRSLGRLSYAEGEAGVSRGLTLTQPFYSTLAPWSGDVLLSAFRGRTWLYRDGEKSGRYRLRQDRAYAHASVYGGDDARWQLGVGLELDDRISHPLTGESLALADLLRSDRRRQVSVIVGRLSRRFERVREMDGAGDVEDHALGSREDLVLGLELATLGSSADRPYVAIGITRSFRLGRAEFASAHLGFSGHWKDGVPDGRQLAAVLRAYGQRWRGRSQAARLLFRWGDGFHPEEIVYIGARAGLRGFPFRAFRGDRVFLANLEERVFPGLWLFGLDTGFALFADAGYAWERPAPIRFRDVRTDIGLGLRIRNVRLLPAVFRLDVARGLGPDGDLQLTISTGQAFGVRQRLDFVEPLPLEIGDVAE